MAKVGNEAKLILRLAQERMEKRRIQVSKTTIDEHNVGIHAGYNQAFNDYTQELRNIIQELEN